MRHVVVLVPGFFGFEHVAEIPYFTQADELLHAAFAQYAPQIHLRVMTAAIPPTASLESRAVALRAFLHTSTLGYEQIHLVGHSSGGLDLRAFLEGCPTGDSDYGEILERVASAITVATPHWGTPLASLATGMGAQRVLKLASVLTAFALHRGRRTAGTLLRLGKVIARLDNLVGLKGTVLDRLYDELLTRAPRDYVAGVRDHVREVGRDTGLIRQLRPAACAARNLNARLPEGLHFGCVVTRANPPSWPTIRAIGRDPYAQANHVLYRTLYKLAGRTQGQILGEPDWGARAEFQAVFGCQPEVGDNDGIVPTLSQLWGPLICAVRGDHLDVMGYFEGELGDSWHIDWMASASGFTQPGYCKMWWCIAAFMLGIEERRS